MGEQQEEEEEDKGSLGTPPSEEDITILSGSEDRQGSSYRPAEASQDSGNRGSIGTPAATWEQQQHWHPRAWHGSAAAGQPGKHWHPSCLHHYQQGQFKGPSSLGLQPLHPQAGLERGQHSHSKRRGRQTESSDEERPSRCRSSTPSREEQRKQTQSNGTPLLRAPMLWEPAKEHPRDSIPPAELPKGPHRVLTPQGPGMLREVTGGGEAVAGEGQGWQPGHKSQQGDPGAGGHPRDLGEPQKLNCSESLRDTSGCHQGSAASRGEVVGHAPAPEVSGARIHGRGTRAG